MSLFDPFDPLGPGFPRVQGTCPACGSASLFLGSGGYVTCSSRPCPDPTAPSKALGRNVRAALTGDAETETGSQAPSAALRSDEPTAPRVTGPTQARSGAETEKP